MFFLIYDSLFIAVQKYSFSKYVCVTQKCETDVGDANSHKRGQSSVLYPSGEFEGALVACYSFWFFLSSATMRSTSSAAKRSRSAKKESRAEKEPLNRVLRVSSIKPVVYSSRVMMGV